jgi:very-long-chain (3R)-3-hydroxyacyl-CoA dehydratase
MVLAWSLTEVIRYAFYATSLISQVPYALLYLRYTTFFVLYPLGAGSEAFLIYSTLPSSSPHPIPTWRSWVWGIWTLSDYIRGAMFLIWWPGKYCLFVPCFWFND